MHAGRKSDGESCQLYLRIELDAESDPREFDAVLHALRPAVLLLSGVGGALEQAAGFINMARRQNIVVLIENDMHLVKELDADGLHLRAGDYSLSEVRSFLGEEKSLGVSCALSRHDSMTMGEQGADYIAFGEILEPSDAALSDLTDMIRWWNEIFEIPCVAWVGERHHADDIRALIEAGADFLSLGSSFWSGAGSERRIEQLAQMVASHNA